MADPTGAPPYGPNCSQFHFSENLAKSYWHPRGVGAPPTGNPGSASGSVKLATSFNKLISLHQDEVADTGFPSGGGGQPIIQPKFPEELHENEENWSYRGAHPKFYSVNQPLDSNVMKFGDNELQRAYLYSL